MADHNCEQLEFIGHVKEFMESTKGVRASIVTICIAIVIQVATFAFLWGSLTAVVSKNTDYLWHDVTIKTNDNSKNIDKILGKFELITVLRGSQGVDGKTGATGATGSTGARGESGRDALDVR